MKIGKRTIVICMLMVVGQMSKAQQEVPLGVIEGFTWDSSDSVLGVYGKYTNTQRDDLIATLAKPLNAYLYVPHDDSLDPSYSWSSVELSEWTHTVSNANKNGIKITMGIRPGYIDSVSSSLSVIENKISSDFIPAGVSEYMLAWDDTPGAGTTDQMKLQADLINALVANSSLSSLCSLVCIVPSAYYPGAGVDPTHGTWAQKLQILDGADVSVKFVVTGEEVTPSSLSPSDVPPLSSGREFIMWDNWIATDTNTQVTMSFPPNRNSSLYSYGYGLNLAFPPERIIHQLKALIASSSYQTPSVPTIATQWAQYLVDKSFVTTDNQSAASSCLDTIINNGVEQISQITSECPILSTTFANEGQNATAASSSSSDNSIVSTSSKSSASSLVSHNVILSISIFMVILSIF